MHRLTNTDYSTRVIHGAYYPHIDGIRALAVLPVVLFHVFAALCPGGFAGVDVFFVISGYLITGGIRHDLETGRFTIRNFYHRRIRRIMPAYVAMIAGVMAVGCLLYYATPLVYLADSVTASTLFLANFHFWRIGGDYFGPILHTQALLHLWSLSVEEQFYLVIPLLCALVWKTRRRAIVPVLAFLALLSLAGAIHEVAAGRRENAFFLIHLRAWELLAGSLLAMTSTSRSGEPAPPEGAGRVRFRAVQSLAAIAGLLLVAGTYATISEKTAFPGAAALPAVIGTALLIRFGQSGVAGRILQWRPFVLTGKISYSLYLWHWPVIVFWRYATYGQLNACDAIGMFLVSLLLGYLSWRLVELPVRSSAAWTMRRTFLAAACCSSVLVTAGTVCVLAQGWATMLHPRANQAAGMVAPLDPFLRAKFFAILRTAGTAFGHAPAMAIRHQHQQWEALEAYNAQGGDGDVTIGAAGPVQLYLVGDSHAGSLRYGLDLILREHHLAGFASTHSSTDMFDLSRREAQEALRRMDNWPQLKVVLISELWMRRFCYRPEAVDAMYAQLEAFIRRVQTGNRRVLVATDIPYFGFSPPDILARMQIIAPRRPLPEWLFWRQDGAEYDRLQGRPINVRLAELCRKTGAILVPLHAALLENGAYVIYDQNGDKPVALYRNGDHLTLAGSMRLAQTAMPFILQSLDLPVAQASGGSGVIAQPTGSRHDAK